MICTFCCILSVQCECGLFILSTCSRPASQPEARIFFLALQLCQQVEQQQSTTWKLCTNLFSSRRIASYNLQFLFLGVKPALILWILCLSGRLLSSANATAPEYSFLCNGKHTACPLSSFRSGWSAISSSHSCSNLSDTYCVNRDLQGGMLCLLNILKLLIKWV